MGKNQGGCGSCWAFSATETVESAYAIASGKLLELAPQTYVNCVKNPNKCGGTGGCEGATMELAFNLTAQTGIALESSLPYAGRDETCSTYKAAVKVSGYVKNPVNDAKALETAVATKGPQAITVAAEVFSVVLALLWITGSSLLDIRRTTGLFATRGVQAGVRKDSFASAGRTMQRLSLTRSHQMVLRVLLTPKRRQSEESVESCLTPLIQLVQLLLMKPWLSEGLFNNPDFC